MAGRGREPILRADQRQEVRELYDEGKYTQKQLAWLFKVNIRVIERVIRPPRKVIEHLDLHKPEEKPVMQTRDDIDPLLISGASNYPVR